VSSTLDRVDWNAELMRGDLGQAVQQVKQAPGKGRFTGGGTAPAGVGGAGLSKRVDLKLVDRLEFGSGAAAMRCEPRR
jgi:hypothetical protein